MVLVTHAKRSLCRKLVPTHGNYVDVANIGGYLLEFCPLSVFRTRYMEKRDDKICLNALQQLLEGRVHRYIEPGSWFCGSRPFHRHNRVRG